MRKRKDRAFIMAAHNDRCCSPLRAPCELTSDRKRVFGAFLYLGLERYLDCTLQRTLVAERRTIATQLLSQLPAKDTAWLATEINEAYAPEVNGLFIRVVHQNVGVVYLSGAPKDGTFDPWRIPFPSEKEMDGSRKLQFESGNRLLINLMTLAMPGGNRFLIESGAPYH